MISVSQFVLAQNLSESALQDILKVLELKDNSLEVFMHDLMLLAKLDAETIESRLKPILLQQCMIHLADDLADGDCTYLPDCESQGPTALCSLQVLVSLSLLNANLNPDGIRNFYSQMLKVGSAQHEEIRTTQWTLPCSREAAGGLNGALFSAYFSLIWEGTQFETLASELGFHFGIACHVATDIKSRDVRYMHLKKQDRISLREWGLASANYVYDQEIPRLREQLLPALAYLR